VTRIAVVGNGGSGKTWLALRLADALHVPVIHLDLYRYDAEGRRRDDDTFVNEVQRKLDEPSWVADGNYLGTLGDRLSRADVVVFLDLPAVVCLVGVLARRVRNKGRRVEDAVHVDLFGAAFVKYVLTYDISMRPLVLAQLAEAQCRVVRVRSRRQARALLGETFWEGFR
jgi:adenylate kinase family enzyme